MNHEWMVEIEQQKHKFIQIRKLALGNLAEDKQNRNIKRHIENLSNYSQNILAQAIKNRLGHVQNTAPKSYLKNLNSNKKLAMTQVINNSGTINSNNVNLSGLGV